MIYFADMMSRLLLVEIVFLVHAPSFALFYKVKVCVCAICNIVVSIYVWREVLLPGSAKAPPCITS